MQHTLVFLSFYVLLGSSVNFKYLSPHSLDPFYSVYNHQWEKVPTTLNFAEQKKCAKFLLSQVGKGYDIPGAWLYWVPMRREKKEYNRYFCSQLVACAVNHCNKSFPNPSSLSPNSLYKYMIR